MSGNVNWKTAPRGALALAHKRPPCPSTIERQIVSPRPMPFGLVVWKALKRFSDSRRRQSRARIANGDQHFARPGLARRDQQLPRAFARSSPRYVTRYTEGFSHFVASMTAPVASGLERSPVGLAPTGKRRLLTAHANSGRSPPAWRRGQSRGSPRPRR